MTGAPSTDIEAEVRAAWDNAIATEHATSGRKVRVSPSAEDPARILAEPSTRVTLQALDEVRGSCLSLNASGLADLEGRVAALVGISGRGKTTAASVPGRSAEDVTDKPRTTSMWLTALASMRVTPSPPVRWIFTRTRTVRGVADTFVRLLLRGDIE